MSTLMTKRRAYVTLMHISKDKEKYPDIVKPIEGVDRYESTGYTIVENTRKEQDDEMRFADRAVPGRTQQGWVVVDEKAVKTGDETHSSGAQLELPLDEEN